MKRVRGPTLLIGFPDGVEETGAVPGAEATHRRRSQRARQRDLTRQPRLLDRLRQIRECDGAQCFLAPRAYHLRALTCY
jgi:hypothetical protein